MFTSGYTHITQPDQDRTLSAPRSHSTLKGNQNFDFYPHRSITSPNGLAMSFHRLLFLYPHSQLLTWLPLLGVECPHVRAALSFQQTHQPAFMCTIFFLLLQRRKGVSPLITPSLPLCVGPCPFPPAKDFESSVSHSSSLPAYFRHHPNSFNIASVYLIFKK